MSQKIASRKEKRSMYEIYRSCRLCGADEGYKMPIIQNIIEVEDPDVELSQLIKECAQIEVAIDDKMPPLICERCIDKLNRFYEFKSLCKNVNNQTRTTLGLLLQNPSLIPVQKEQSPTKKTALRSRPRLTRQTEPSGKGSRPLKEQSSSRILKNRSRGSKFKTKTVNEITEDKEENTSNGVQVKEVHRLETQQSNIAAESYNGDKKFQCDVCQYRCSRNSHLKIHIRIHTGEKPYKCIKCEYRCKSSSHLRQHCLRKHTNKTPFQCNICRYKCTASGDLKIHKRTHTGERPYKCNICEHRCISSTLLNRHMSTHNGKRRFNCDICEYSCSVLFNLNRHKSKHTGEKLYQCNVCGYRCYTLGDLNIHKRIHTGEKPYPCDMCKYRCNTSSALTMHKRTHTGEQPYQCKECELRFSIIGNLRRHEKTHTREQPYQCKECELRFSLIGNLRRHEKRQNCNKIK